MEKGPDDVAGVDEVNREVLGAQMLRLENPKLDETDARLLFGELDKVKIDIADFLANEIGQGADLIECLNGINEKKDIFLSMHLELKEVALRLADRQKAERIQLSIARYLRIREIKAATQGKLRQLKEKLFPDK